MSMFTPPTPSEGSAMRTVQSKYGELICSPSCREFAAQYPSDNVRRAIALAESGTITWHDVAGLFRRALTKALEEV